MAELQNIGGAGGYAPLRVQRSFREFDDGRGARAAALAESLGVVLNAAPKVVKAEGDKAFKAGMEARIDGVKRENAQSGNKSMLGFMFSRRAQDGFDYQDAQLEIPVLQSETLLEMNSKLRESRNPNDFRAYIANQDAALQERFSGKSDIYRYTVADAMQKTRADQAKLFTSWVQSNREKDKRAAAAAAAKAQASMRAAQRREAGNAAYEAITAGDSVDAMGDFVKSMAEQGIPANEAKEIFFNEAYTVANEQNDPGLLEEIDPKFLDPKLRVERANGIDKLEGQRIQREEYRYKMEQREIGEREDAEMVELNSSLREAILEGATASNITATALDSPVGRRDPDAALKLAETYSGINDALVDPVQETILFESFEAQAQNMAVAGDAKGINKLANELVASGQIKSGNIEKIFDIAETAQVWDDDFVKDTAASYHKTLEADFQPESVAQGDMTPLDIVRNQGAEVQTYHRSVSQGANRTFDRKFRLGVSKYVRENDTNARDIPMQAIDLIAERAYNQTLREVQASQEYKQLLDAYNNAATVSEQQVLGDAPIEGRNTNLVTPSESLSVLKGKAKSQKEE